jgi:hypothetical protein
VRLVLQSCADPLYILPVSSTETFLASSDSSYGVGNIKVEEDIDVMEESFIAINEEVDISFKEEEIPEDRTFPDIKAEPEKVSYVYIRVFFDTYDVCPVWFLSVFLDN